MNKDILVITDNANRKSYKSITKNAVSENSKIYILLLGITREHFQTSNSKKYLDLEKCAFIDIKDVSNSLQEKVRNFYINFIFKTSENYGDNLFFCDNKYMWWYLEITEKCPVRSKSVKKIFYLEAIQYAIKQHDFRNIYIDIEDIGIRGILLKWSKKIRPISHEIFKYIIYRFKASTLYFISGYIKNLLKVFLLFFSRSLTLDMLGLVGIKPQEKDALIFFTNYPFWWASPYEKCAKEKFFGSLADFIDKRYPAYYLAMLFSLTPFTILLKRKYLSAFLRHNKVIVLDRFLRKNEIAKILSLKYLFWAIKTHRYFKVIFNLPYDDFNIRDLISSEMNRSLSHVELFNDILLENAIFNFKEAYKPKALVYRIEFQPFEKALLNGVAKGFPVIAFQHSTFSQNRLSHSFASKELLQHLSGGEKAMPLPDIIFTTGKYFYDILTNEGFPKENLGITGPVRYSHLIDYLKLNKNVKEIKNKLGVSEKDNIFLVAMNWFKEEVMALVYALKDLDIPVHLIFRSHPHMNFNKEIKYILRKHKVRFKYSFLEDSSSLYDVIMGCNGMIQILNTLGYEAIALGKTPIIYENRNTYDMNSSEEIKDYIPVVCNSSELKQAILNIINERDTLQKMQQKYASIVEKFFYNLEKDPRETFLDLLIEHKIVSKNEIKNTDEK